MKDVRYYAINRDGRQKVEAVNPQDTPTTDEEVLAFVKRRPYWRSVPPTKIIKETREVIFTALEE